MDFLKKRRQRNEYMRRWYAKRKAELGVSPVTAWRRANPEANARHRESERKRRIRSPESKASAAIRVAINKYGLTLDQYHSLYERQNFCCAICGEYLDTPHVDHNHKTGKVRAMLCGPCNWGIGHFKESVARLVSAIAYLQKHESEWV